MWPDRSTVTEVPIAPERRSIVRHLCGGAVVKKPSCPVMSVSRRARWRPRRTGRSPDAALTIKQFPGCAFRVRPDKNDGVDEHGKHPDRGQAATRQQGRAGAIPRPRPAGGPPALRSRRGGRLRLCRAVGDVRDVASGLGRGADLDGARSAMVRFQPPSHADRRGVRRDAGFPSSSPWPGRCPRRCSGTTTRPASRGRHRGRVE